MPVNWRSGRQGKAPGATPPILPFIHPVALLDAPGFKDPNAAFTPRVVAEARVAELTTDTIIIQRRIQVAMLPGSNGERFRDWADAGRWTVPLHEGTWTAPDGTQLVLGSGGARLDGLCTERLVCSAQAHLREFGRRAAAQHCCPWRGRDCGARQTLLLGDALTVMFTDDISRHFRDLDPCSLNS